MKLSRFEKTLLDAMVGTKDIGTACSEIIRRGSEFEKKGIGGVLTEKLRKAGFNTVATILSTTVEEFQEIGIDEITAQNAIMAARTTREDLISKGYLTKRGKWPEVRDCYDALTNIRKKFKDCTAYVGKIYSYIQKNPELRNHLIPREPVDRMPKEPRI